MNLSVLTASISRNAGGLFTSVRRLTQAMQECGVNCVVSSMEDKYTAQDMKKWAPVNTRVYPRSGLRQFPFSRPMRDAVIGSKPDLLHSHGIWQYHSIVDLAAKKKLKVPNVVSPRGMLDSWALKNSVWKKHLAGWWFETRHLANASCIHALCKSEAESVRAYGLMTPIAIIPNGIDVPSASSNSQSTSSAKKRRLLFLGRIHPKKGVGELLQAWKNVIASSVVVGSGKDPASGWELVVAGWDDGGHGEGLKAKARELGIEPSVRFVGPSFGDEKDALLRSVDAFVLPSFSEGLPMSVLEAWAYGLPVVMTPQCNLSEGFKAEAALFTEPNAVAITSALTKLFHMSEDQKHTMGKRGRELVASQFAWKQIAEEMISVYKWLLGHQEQPDCVVTASNRERKS